MNDINNKVHFLIFLSSCLQDFYTNEMDLFDVDIGERALTAKLACYLDGRAKEMSNGVIRADAEYNRHIKDSKAGLNIDSAESYVTPDIIVHQRKTDDNNIAVIEVKKNASSDTSEHDYEKVRNLVSRYGYLYGIEAYSFELNRFEMYLFSKESLEKPVRYRFNFASCSLVEIGATDD